MYHGRNIIFKELNSFARGDMSRQDVLYWFFSCPREESSSTIESGIKTRWGGGQEMEKEVMFELTSEPVFKMTSRKQGLKFRAQ